MKFYQSAIINNWDKFSLHSRTLLDLFLLHKTCEYFQPKQLLEIGFAEGKTLSTLVDSAPSDANFTTLDKSFADKKNFCSLHSDDLHRISFVETDSTKYDYSTTYDLILVDGNHSYETVKMDLENSFNCISKSGIMVLDDVIEEWPGVLKSVNEFLEENTDWLPFMKGDQTLWVHHVSHDASEFLDVFLPSIAEQFVSFYNYELFGTTVLVPNTFDIFNEEVSVSRLICKTLNL